MPTKPPKKQSVRLPGHITPIRYHITLKPDLERFTFEGEETIRIKLARSEQRITLHAKELAIEVVEAEKGAEKLFAQRISYDEKAETAAFAFPRALPKGELSLRLVFRGILNDQMRGFYRSHFEADGKKHTLATTQFEATDARRAFPCFDEPAAKAVFDVNLIVPQESVAISNTLPIEIREHEAGYKIVSFAPTPKMSTYLLAFIVGKFEWIEKKTADGVLVRVFVTPGKKHQAQFALDCAVKILPFFSRYFGIRYPLPALDLIAIPDFAAGAMENWGAITYRESALLVDPEHTSAATRQWVALVIAHELSHQWFGNLVTMEWWTHLWLNEGFASYIEYLAVDHLFPQWNIWTQFAYQDLGRALELDALKHSHPIEVDVHHPDEISEIFDAVSYSKGASVIRMLAEYIGERNFRDGLRYYLKKHSYANTSTVHLWEAFEKISEKPVRRLMAQWTRRVGYPVVSARRENGALTLDQKRFFSSPLSARSTDRTVWPIPLSIRIGSNTAAKHMLMERRRERIPVPRSAWIKLNSGESGVFRTRYAPDLLAALEKPVRRRKLEPLDRLGLVRDAFALAEAAELPSAEALKLAQSYVGETDYTVWTEIASGLGDIWTLIARGPLAAPFESFARRIFADVARRVGWQKRPRENHTDTLLRSLALSNFGMYGDTATITRIRRMFRGVTERKNRVPADLRNVVYGLAARNGGAPEHRKLTRLYIRAELHEEKNRLGRALALFGDAALLQRTLAFALSRHVRQQDTIGIVATVWTNPYGRELAWKFVRKHWKTFLNRYGGQHGLAALIHPAGLFAMRAKAREIRSFFRTHQIPGAERAVQQAIERIYANEMRLRRDKQVLEEFLQRDGQSVY
ncbi:M1 family peptidase [Candidatus Parcubacteria bacterium]|nr:MAG: M1 family peptidase [Candidatus Parcubacteria bacterium]